MKLHCETMLFLGIVSQFYKAVKCFAIKENAVEHYIILCIQLEKWQ